MVVAGWVEGEFADELPVVLGDDPQLQVAGEDEDFGAAPEAIFTVRTCGDTRPTPTNQD